MNKKYSNLLTIILILIIIAIVAIIGFLGFKYYQTYTSKSEAEDFVDAWGKDEHNNKKTNKNDGSVIPPAEDKNDDKDEGNLFDGVEDSTNTNDSGTGGNTQKFNGFEIAGTIEIPATKLKCPVIAQSEYSPKALETSVVQIYGPGLNQVGNTTISGHNYRNGTFFSNNKKLNVGDKIYITDLSGKRLTYTIYEKFEADDNYSDYMTRDTQGAIEISLSTCTDNSKARIIILAKAEV